MNRSLVKNISLLTICNTIQFIIAFIQSVILAHAIDAKYAYGLLQQIFLISAIITAVGAAIPSAMSFFWGQSNQDKINSDFFLKYFYAAIIVSAFFSVTIFFASTFLSDYFNNKLFLEWKFYILLYLFFKCLNNFSNGLYLLTNKLMQLFVLNVLNFTTILLWLTYLLIIKTPIYLIFCGLVTIELFKTVYLFKDHQLFFTKRSLFSLPNYKEWRYIITLILMMLLTVMNAQADRLFVAKMLGPESYSDYAVGTFANPFIGLITGSMMTVLIPVFSKLFHEKNFKLIVKIWKRTTLRACVLLLPLIIFTIIFGDQIILLIYPPKFVLASKLFQLYNIKYIFTVVIFSGIINVTGQEKWMLVNSIINNITLCLLCIIFIPIWNVYGAILASIISLFLGYSLPIWLTKKYLHATFKTYFPVSFFIRTLSICLVAALAIKFVIQQFSSNKYMLFISGLFYVTICYGFLVKSKKAYLNKFNVLKYLFNEKTV